jgi:hypothetical protein
MHCLIDLKFAAHDLDIGRGIINSHEEVIGLRIETLANPSVQMYEFIGKIGVFFQSLPLF